MDDTAEATRRAKDTVRAIYEEAALEQDDDRRKIVVKHAASSEADTRIRAMLNLARAEESVPVVPDELDRDAWLLNVENGTLDLRTCTLRPHQREDQARSSPVRPRRHGDRVAAVPRPHLRG
jgi:putative DNA primase/helicase